MGGAWVVVLGVFRSGLMPTSLGHASLRNESAGQEAVVKSSLGVRCAEATDMQQCFSTIAYH